MRLETIHVVPNKMNGWNVKISRKKAPVRNFYNKKSAEYYAHALSKKRDSELVIHGRNGKIQRRDSHGNDPFPPRG